MSDDEATEHEHDTIWFVTKIEALKSDNRRLREALRARMMSYCDECGTKLVYAGTHAEGCSRFYTEKELVKEG